MGPMNSMPRSGYRRFSFLGIETVGEDDDVCAGHVAAVPDQPDVVAIEFWAPDEAGVAFHANAYGSIAG
jgi:hypothetical protein